jgi:hypothetical protein
MKWFDERHSVVHIASDLSGYKWGGVLMQGHQEFPLQVAEFWEADKLPQPIHIKEMRALCRCLVA